MNRLLPAFSILCFLFFANCKRDKKSEPTPETIDLTISGDITLSSQTEVDVFVAQYKGHQLKINGNLSLGGGSTPVNNLTSLSGLSLVNSISGQLSCSNLNLSDVPLFHTLTSVGSITINSSNIVSLNFEKLNAFSGTLNISNMSELKEVKIEMAPAVSNVSISTCPKLDDLKFLNNISSAGTISIAGTSATMLSLDKLSSLNFSFYVTDNNNLTNLSCPLLKTAASMMLSGDKKLTTLNFPSLTNIRGKCILAYIGITDLSGLNTVQSLGALQLYSNPELSNLHGLEKLTHLTMDGVVTNTIGNSSDVRINGVYIRNNIKLASLSGLQNIRSVPIAYITDNPLLTDLCPFKQNILGLSTASSLSYTYQNELGRNSVEVVPALTLTNNGSYSTKQEALAIVAQCP